MVTWRIAEGTTEIDFLVSPGGGGGPRSTMAAPYISIARPDLGPKQLAWCEQHLGHFKRYKDQADKAAAESEQQRRELGW